MNAINEVKKNVSPSGKGNSMFAQMKNNTNYPNGTIVEIYSATHRRWVLGEVIGAKSEVALNIRYLKYLVDVKIQY